MGKKTAKIDKYAPPSVVKVSRQWKRLLASARAKGTYFPGMRRLIADSERAAVIGRYMLDDRWSGKNRKDED